MKNILLDLIDFKKLENLLEGFNKTTGYVSAVLDLEGNILSKSGWRQICTEFHRIHPETSKNCVISDTELAIRLNTGKNYCSYKCLNGLMDVAVPIVINGEHIANLFTGQFFFEEPDRDYFKKQASKYGFDQTKYLEALEKVPIVSKEKAQEIAGFLTNITLLISEMALLKLEQPKLYNEVEERKNQYLNLANSGNALIWKAGTDKLCNYFNDPWLKFTGRILEQEVGNGWTEGIHPDDHNRCIETYTKAFEKQEPFEMQYRLRHASGDYRMVLQIGTPNFDSKGEFTGYIGHCTDITERKQAEEALLRNNTQLEHSHYLMDYIIKHNRSAVAVHDKDLKYIYVSQRYIDDFGIKESEIIGKHHYDLFPDLPQRWREVHQKALSGEVHSAERDPFYRKDGSILWTRWECRPWYESDGEIGGIIIYTEEITERIKAEEELKSNYDLLQIAGKTARFGGWSVDLEKIICTWSDAVAEILEVPHGHKPTLEEGMDFYTPEWRQRIKSVFSTCAQEGTPYDEEMEILTKKGKRLWVRSIGKAVKNDKGKIIKIHGSLQDISEQKKSEEALRYSENRFRSLLQNIPSISVQGYQMDGTLIYWNEASEKLYGYTSEEAIGKNILDLIIPHEMRNEVAAEIKNMSKTRKAIPPSEMSLLRKDGFQVPVFSSHTMLNSDGDNPELFCVDLDLTKIKKAESLNKLQYNIAHATITTKNLKELLESLKNELNNIIDAKNIFIAFYNEETGILSADIDENEKEEISEWTAKRSLTGYLIAQNRPLLLRKKDVLHLYEKGIIDLYGTIAEAWLGIPLKVEEEILGAIVIQNYENPDIYDQSSIKVMELVAHELSLFIDRQRIEEKSNKLSRAIEQSPLSIVITNKEGIIEYVNPFFSKLSGYSFDEAKGKNSNILKSGHHSSDFYKELWETILSGKDWEGEILNKKKNGSLYWVKSIISTITNNKGDITNYISIKEDITERKKMLEELVSAKEKAEESDSLKTKFLNNMSHEIRTPMNGIIGFSDMLDDPGLSEEKRKNYSKIIQNSSHQLLRIIDDILEIAALETKKEKAHKTEFNLNDFLMNLFSIFNLKSKERNIPLYLKKELHDDQSFIISDKTKLNIIISNLLENALKFTNTGFIEFGYFIENEILKLFVKDTGIGIASKNHHKVFERFSQEDEEISNTHGGLGLGLSISKEYAILLGGDITLDSEKGKGSTFIVSIPYIPLRKQEDSNNHYVSSIGSGEHNILVAEDEEVNYLYIQALFETETDGNYNLTHAKNGQEALEICVKNKNIDLVLMDKKCL
ncbi:PAS domain S-box protein [Natronoflexus pectinivorans]|uniref:histidine kinase n=1 Tax=Natronoflexus pectinivorans TaxID=682526 RepID=A0A4R2GDC6_9BACT|nr:PAS domain S-box protein [Natronoflexus pectinivorans]TCO06046.1 PAS domain S-box-containing protein [Natronoflexus pectinivorans]